MTTDDVKVAPYASDAGHWYTQGGEIIEEVRRASGDGYTRCTLYHARKLNLAPGVTTIIRAAAAPQLELWKQRQAILAALTLPRMPGESEGDWLARVDVDMRESAKKAAEEGTRIHAAIERHYGGMSVSPEYTAHVAGVADLLDRTVGTQSAPWLPEKAAVHRYGYATKSDLHSMDWCIDFKGKDGTRDELQQLSTYESHHMQLAATRAALGAPDLRCAIVYVSRTHPGHCAIHEVSRERLSRGWDMFAALLRYWQAKNTYRPAWAQEIGS